MHNTGLSKKHYAWIMSFIGVCVILICGFFLYRAYYSAYSTHNVSDDQLFILKPTLTREQIIKDTEDSNAWENLEFFARDLREIFLQRYDALDVNLFDKEAQTLVANAHRIINAYTEETIARADTQTIDALIEVLQFMIYYDGSLSADDRNKLIYALKRKGDEFPAEEIDATVDFLIESMKSANLIIEEKKKNPSIDWKKVVSQESV